MKDIQIIDEKSFIKYCKDNNLSDIDSYLKIINTYKNSSIHNLYYLSFYILNRMQTKYIKNNINYFRCSLLNNINKLNSYNKSSLPSWFNKTFETKKASDKEIKEIDDLIKSIQ